MTFWVSRFVSALLLAGALVLAGCLPSAQSQLDEEKEPHFLTGKTCVNEMDFKGAITSFEKALEANPHSGAAHFELAILYEQREHDAAAAIYHFQQYLRLRPIAENAEIVNQHILACKQELARTVSLAPVTARQQREFEQYAEDNKRLRDEVDRWKAYAAHLQMLTNPPAPPPLIQVMKKSDLQAEQPLAAPTRGAPPASRPRVMAATATTSRTHRVASGETPTTIARRYGIKVEALMAANPRLDARHMRVGQNLNLPQ